jgi:hypothetical protein
MLKVLCRACAWSVEAMLFPFATRRTLPRALPP